jgi:hypothetical protein
LADCVGSAKYIATRTLGERERSNTARRNRASACFRVCRQLRNCIDRSRDHQACSVRLLRYVPRRGRQRTSREAIGPHFDTSRSVPPYCTRRFTGTFLFSTTKIDIRTSSRESCIASNQALSATDSLHSVKVVQRYGRYESICMLRVAAAHGGLHSITQYI